jgi:hypothetical protein
MPFSLFDRLIRVTREYADRYYPRNHRAVLVVAPAGYPDLETVLPIGYLCVPIPDAGAVPEPDDDGPPPGAVKMPGCAQAVIATLLQQPDPMAAAEIEAALRDSEVYPAYSLSSIEKTLAELVRVGLLRNPPGARPRGYRFAEG